MAKAKKRSDAGQVEWVGGLVSLPAYVTGEDEGPYRPETLLWMIPDGPVLGTAMFKPGEGVTHVVDHFHETTRKPMVGRAHVPSRVRVESPEVAAQLRASLRTATDVICAPTPEIDAIVASMREHLDAHDADEPPTHFGPGITPDAMASFFRASARLFRAAPWIVIPDDASVLRVTIDSLGVRDAVLSVIGQLGESLGFLLFASVHDYEEYLDAAECMKPGDESPQLSPHYALNFDRGAELDPALRKEIATHGWEVAAPNAYPWLIAVDEDVVGRPPTAEELTRFEAIAIALAELTETERELDDCWRRDREVVRTISAQTHAGTIDVTLAAPYDAGVEARPTRTASTNADAFDIHADARTTDGDLDEESAEAYCEEVMAQFAASPEADALDGDIGWANTVMELGMHHLGVTVAGMTPAHLREILFELIPRKVTSDASEAGKLVGELRAFFAFLKRAHGLRNMDACLRVLDGDAAKRFDQAMSDPRNFGMAKSIMMAGADAGFDISTREGAMAWMREVQRKPLPPSIPLPALGPPPPRARVSSEAQRAKKDRRKAERKARRKNR
jgi:hypothetical protein